jgi:hypothetical protein
VVGTSAELQLQKTKEKSGGGNKRNKVVQLFELRVNAKSRKKKKIIVKDITIP